MPQLVHRELTHITCAPQNVERNPRVSPTIRALLVDDESDRHKPNDCVKRYYGFFVSLSCKILLRKIKMGSHKSKVARPNMTAPVEV